MKTKKKDSIKRFSKSLWSEYEREKGYKLDQKEYNYCIYEGSKRIGYIKIQIISGVAILEELIIKSEFRNKKYGHEALDFFEKLAKNHNCHKLRIKTCPEYHEAAYQLYKKYGYKQEAVTKKDYLNKDWIILSKYNQKVSPNA